MTNKVFSTRWFVLKITLIFFYTSPLVYGISARTLDDYITYSLIIAPFSFSILVLAVWSIRLKNSYAHGRRSPAIAPKDMLIFSAGNAIISVLMGVLCYSAAVAAVDFFNWILHLNQIDDRRRFAAISAAAILILGWLFFWMRQRIRFTYGLIEASVGAAFAAFRYSAENEIGLPVDTGFYFAMLTAGVYLVVRGLDNMQQGWKEGNDPLAILVLSLGAEPIHSPPPQSPSYRRLRRSDISKKNLKHKSKANRIVEKQPEM